MAGPRWLLTSAPALHPVASLCVVDCALCFWHAVQAAAAVVTAAYPATNKLSPGSGTDSSSSPASEQRQSLSVPDESLLVVSRGPLRVQQLALALQTVHQGCEGVSRFVHLALTSSFRDTLVKSGDPAVAV